MSAAYIVYTDVTESYTKTPNEIAFHMPGSDYRLSLPARALWSTLRHFAYLSADALTRAAVTGAPVEPPRWTNDEMAKWTGVGVSTVKNAKKELIEAGLLLSHEVIVRGRGQVASSYELLNPATNRGSESGHRSSTSQNPTGGQNMATPGWSESGHPYKEVKTEDKKLASSDESEPEPDRYVEEVVAEKLATRHGVRDRGNYAAALRHQPDVIEEAERRRRVDEPGPCQHPNWSDAIDGLPRCVACRELVAVSVPVETRFRPKGAGGVRKGLSNGVSV